MLTDARRRATFAALVILGMAAGTSAARAQVPVPTVPDAKQRSGLITRFMPVPRVLPEDNRRDKFDGVRYLNDPWGQTPYRNCYKDGGLYGKPWPADCTTSTYPYFHGAPGQSTNGPGCMPYRTHLGRAAGNFVHPFRPVCYYYDRGSCVPIYDLDPWVPGPGPFPWPFLKSQWLGG